MHMLSSQFMECLQSGFLADLAQFVRDDHDLNLEIRDGYINVYFKGNSLLKLTEKLPSRYHVDIHKSFTTGLEVPGELIDGLTTKIFLRNIPMLKQNVIHHGKSSMEIEYEQMLIRANNFEKRNNSEYFIVDRQYALKNLGRLDLVGIFWDRKRRRQKQEVELCVIEVKFALNKDIDAVHLQLARYYEALKPIAPQIAKECEIIFRQKLELGLYAHSQDRLEAMKTLVISRDIAKFQFILVLVDYNPNSGKLKLDDIAKLPFADQIKIFFTGSAMWQQHVNPIIDYQNE
jgi:hypothetical protein